MFLRTHRVGYTIYTEALEAFRDPVTRKSKHRCLARWPAHRSLAEAISDADKNASAWLRNAKSWAPRYGRSPPSKDYQRALKAHQRARALAATLRSVQARLNDQENARAAKRAILKRMRNQYPGSFKLSEKEIAEIKVSALTQRELARKYKVTQSTISRIKKPKNP